VSEITRREEYVVKTIIKILIAAAIINAVARGGFAASSYYQLKDDTYQVVTFGAESPTDQIQNQILESAQKLNLPLDADNVEVTRNGLNTTAVVEYTQPVEFFPSYTYPLNFKFTVEATATQGGGAARVVRP
jgi:hypothetical protein